MCSGPIRGSRGCSCLWPVSSEWPRLVFSTAGGGGHGIAAARDPASVQADLRNGKVSLEAAREFYGYRGNV